MKKLTDKQEEKLEEDFQNYLYSYLQWGKGGESMEDVKFIRDAYRYIYIQGMEAVS